MTMTRKTVSVILAVTIFCGLFTIVFAVANTNTNDEHAYL